MRSIRVTYENGNTVSTNINGTNKEINAYYLGKYFNVGVGEKDDMQKAVKVEFIDEYKSQSARDAQAGNYGDEKYWAYLDQAAQEHYDYYMAHNEPEKAASMFTQSLSDCLRGNEGD